MAFLAVLILKPLLYIAVMAFGARRWAAGIQNNLLRIILGGLARFALGAVVGIPLGIFLRQIFNEDAGAAFYAIFFTVRFLLWLLVLRLAFLKAPMAEVLGLAAVGAVMNLGLDLALPDTLMGLFRINFC
jgi:hypothetical protein